MADTLQNLVIVPQVWLDVYSESGLAIGTQIIVQNVGVCDVYLVAAASEPQGLAAHQIIQRGQEAINEYGDSGAWAFCLAGGAINLRVA